MTPTEMTIRSVDQFMEEMDKMLKGNFQDKNGHIIQLMSNCARLFDHYKVAPQAVELRKLADRIAPINEEEAKTLRACADAIHFPNQLTRRIVSEIEAPAEIARIVQTSKEMFQIALERPLQEREISNEQEAIDFARQFGPYLTYIDISNTSFNSENLAKLVKFLPNVNTFIANRCAIDSAGAQVLAQAPELKGLTTLSLGFNCVGVAGVTALANSPIWSGVIKELDLAFNGFEDDGTVALVASPTLQLTKLNLAGNIITDVGAVAFARAVTMGNLTELNLENNQIEDAGAQALAQALTMDSLTELNLADNEIGDEGAEAFANLTLLRLETLNLEYNKIGQHGARALTSSERFREIDLDLRHNPLSV